MEMEGKKRVITNVDAVASLRPCIAYLSCRLSGRLSAGLTRWSIDWLARWLGGRLAGRL